MTTRIFITTGLLLLSAMFALGQNKLPAGKEGIRAMKVENSIRSGFYEIIANQVLPMNGQTRYLTTAYSVRISGDSAYVDLPYFGRVYSAPVNGEGGIKIAVVSNNRQGISYWGDLKLPENYVKNYFSDSKPLIILI